MDVDGEAKLLDFVNKELGGWPVLDDSNWDDNKYDPMDTLITSRLYAYRQVVDLVVSNNPKLPQQSALRVCRFSQRIQDRWGSHDWKFLLTYTGPSAKLVL